MMGIIYQIQDLLVTMMQKVGMVSSGITSGFFFLLFLLELLSLLFFGSSLSHSQKRLLVVIRKTKIMKRKI